MKDLILAMDTDDVKASFASTFFQFVNIEVLKVNGKNPDFRYEDMTHWDINLKSPKIIKKTREVGMNPDWFFAYYLNFIDNKDHNFASLPVIPGCREAIDYFVRNNFELFAVTDRLNAIKYERTAGFYSPEGQLRLQHLVQEDTIQWYTFNFPKIFPQSNIIFANGISKAQRIKELGKDHKNVILVEDNYRNAKENALLSDNNYSFLLNRRYNQGTIVDRLVRINGYNHDKFDTISQFQELVERVDSLTKKFIS